MQENDLEFSELVKLIKPYTDKGRPVSIAFLNWFLEHIYRLEPTKAEDIICDMSNDRGIDGIYVDRDQLEIHIFQSKTKQKGTIGDKDLREFSGSLNQLRTGENVQKLVAGTVHAEIKEKIQKIDLVGLLKKGFSVVGVFVTNVPVDANGNDFLKNDTAIRVCDRPKIIADFVDLQREGGIKAEYEFSTDGAPLEHQANDNAKVIVFFADGKQLAEMPEYQMAPFLN
jgi:hypothetical protein